MVESLSELTALVDALRARGVHFFRQGDLELHLAPEAPQAAPEVAEKPSDRGWRDLSQEQRDALGCGD